MSLTSFILKRAVPIPKVDSFHRYLFIGPHPDDIEIGAGATIARLAAAGKEICFLICLDGRFGLENAPAGTTPDELAAIRKEESLAAASALGVSDVRFLGLTDGGLYDPRELYKGILRVIGEVQPEIIFAPDPCSQSESHMDHLNVGEAARRAAYFAPFPEIMAENGAKSAPVSAIAYYMTAKPNRFIGAGKGLPAQKKALLCHKSQYPEDSPAFQALWKYLTIRSIDFGLRSLKGRAEGFRILEKVHMHCLPEI